MVLGFDHFEELLAQFRLLHAPQRGHGEAMLGRTLLGACAGSIVLLGPDGERAIPGSVNIFSKVRGEPCRQHFAGREAGWRRGRLLTWLRSAPLLLNSTRIRGSVSFQGIEFELLVQYQR